MLSRTEKKLFSLIIKDDLVGFSGPYLRSQNVNKLTLGSNGLSFLGECVKNGAIKIASLIIEDEPDLLFKLDSNGNHPLSHLGLLNPRPEMIELFESKGFNLSHSLGKKGNILHIIAPRGSLSLYAELIRKGANQNEANHFGELPMDIAKRFDNKNIIVEHANNYNQAELDI